MQDQSARFLSIRHLYLGSFLTILRSIKYCDELHWILDFTWVTGEMSWEDSA